MVESWPAAARRRDTHLSAAHHVPIDVLDDTDIADRATAFMVLQRPDKIEVANVVDEVSVVTVWVRCRPLAEAEAIPSTRENEAPEGRLRAHEQSGL
jgi:hypothetical protein